MVVYDNNGNIPHTLVGFPLAHSQPFKLVLVRHNESTYYEYDR